MSEVRIGSVTSPESSQYHQDANHSLLLATQKATKVAFSNGSLLSKSKDLDLVNKFNIVYTMPKKCISLDSFPNTSVQWCIMACCVMFLMHWVSTSVAERIYTIYSLHLLE